MSDFHIYHSFQDSSWKSFNPTISDFSFEGRTYRSKENNSCETTIIIRGAEASYRRVTTSLDKYLSINPLLDTHLTNNRDF